MRNNPCLPVDLIHTLVPVWHYMHYICTNSPKPDSEPPSQNVSPVRNQITQTTKTKESTIRNKILRSVNFKCIRLLSEAQKAKPPDSTQLWFNNSASS